MKTLLRLLVILAVCCPIPAVAQDAPPIEVSFGYSYLTRADTTLVQTFSGDKVSPFFRSGGTHLRSKGWFVDVGRDVSRHIGLVGHGSAAYTPGVWDTSSLRADNTAYTLLGGPRFRARSYGPVVPFAQALVGIVRTGAEVKPGPIGRAGDFALPTYHNTFGAFSLGAGVDVRLLRSVGVRVGVDMLRTSRTPKGIDVAQTWRIRTGLIVPMH